MAEKLVKVYDMDAFLDKHFPKEDLSEKVESVNCGPWHEVVALKGPKGVVVACSEGVHQLILNDDDEREFHYQVWESFKPNEKGQRMHACFPSWEAGIDMDSFFEEVPFKRETKLTDFVRTFGSRLESNYHLMLRSIKEIGLDPADYPRVDKRRKRPVVPENN